MNRGTYSHGGILWWSLRKDVHTSCLIYDVNYLSLAPASYNLMERKATSWSWCIIMIVKGEKQVWLLTVEFWSAHKLVINMEESGYSHERRNAESCWELHEMNDEDDPLVFHSLFNPFVIWWTGELLNCNRIWYLREKIGQKQCYSSILPEIHQDKAIAAAFVQKIGGIQ